MQKLKDKYQIEKGNENFSFQPYFRYKNSLKWYVLSFLIIGGILAFYFQFLEQIHEVVTSILVALLIIIVIGFLQELLIKIPIKYQFDARENAIYKSSLLLKNRKIMSLKDVVIFRGSSMGSWHYSMGEKRKQFVKSYTISEDFGSGEKSNRKVELFEEEILNEIYRLQESQL